MRAGPTPALLLHCSNRPHQAKHAQSSERGRALKISPPSSARVLRATKPPAPARFRRQKGRSFNKRLTNQRSEQEKMSARSNGMARPESGRALQPSWTNFKMAAAPAFIIMAVSFTHSRLAMFEFDSELRIIHI